MLIIISIIIEHCLPNAITRDAIFKTIRRLIKLYLLPLLTWAGRSRAAAAAAAVAGAGAGTAAAGAGPSSCPFTGSKCSSVNNGDRCHHMSSSGKWLNSAEYGHCGRSAHSDSTHKVIRSGNTAVV